MKLLLVAAFSLIEESLKTPIQKGTVILRNANICEKQLDGCITLFFFLMIIALMTKLQIETEMRLHPI